MNETTTAKKSAVKTILITGLIAGILDGSAASINALIRGRSPERVFRFIASGVFGTDSNKPGWLMPALGVLFHFFIAYTFTVFFFLIFPKIKWLNKNFVVTGLLYGIFVWLIMNLIVVPLSITGKIRFTNPTQTIIGVLFLMFFIGLPIAYFTKRFYNNRSVELQENFLNQPNYQ
jgi:hypothetical protein